MRKGKRDTGDKLFFPLVSNERLAKMNHKPHCYKSSLQSILVAVLQVLGKPGNLEHEGGGYVET